MSRLSRDNINLILEYACNGLWVLQLDEQMQLKRRANCKYTPISRILVSRIAMPCIFFTLQRRLCIMHRVNDGFWSFSSTEALSTIESGFDGPTPLADGIRGGRNDELLTITIYAYQYVERKYAHLLVDLYCMAEPDFVSGAAAIEPYHIGMAKRIEETTDTDDIYSWQIELDI